MTDGFTDEKGVVILSPSKDERKGLCPHASTELSMTPFFEFTIQTTTK